MASSFLMASFACPASRAISEPVLSLHTADRRNRFFSVSKPIWCRKWRLMSGRNSVVGIRNQTMSRCEANTLPHDVSGTAGA